MLPGPFQMPPLPSLPFYVHPVLLWVIVLVAAVALAITFFKFVFAEKGGHVSAFLTFFLVAIFIIAGYLTAMNWPRVSAWFQRTF